MQSAVFRAVGTIQCLAPGRIVSGEAPSATKAPYTIPDLYSIGGAPNFTAVAADGLATCDAATVFNNSLVGPSGPPDQRLLASFSESCPDIFTESNSGFLSPNDSLKYNCSDACVAWMINYGVCLATELEQV